MVFRGRRRGRRLVGIGIFGLSTGKNEIQIGVIDTGGRIAIRAGEEPGQIGEEAMQRAVERFGKGRGNTLGAK